MLSLAYTISPELKDELAACEGLRRQILLTSLPPKLELKLRWQTQIIRIQDLLNFLGFPVNKNDIVPFLASHTQTSSLPAKAVLAIQNIDHYLWQTWTASTKTINFNTLETLASLSPDKSKSTLKTYLRKLDRPLGQLLDYLQVQNEPPVILAGISLAQIALFTDASPEGLFLGRILSYLLLFRGGYDLNRMLILGEGQKKEIFTTVEVLSETRRRGNATNFLLYFAGQLKNQLARLNEHLVSPSAHLDLPNSFWELNRRQESILNLLNNPAARITNRDVQKSFKISQITASRDLAKLASLNLICPHGKGRSVYYTKV